MVKCYGRRLVLNMGNCSLQTLDDCRRWILSSSWAEDGGGLSSYAMLEEDRQISSASLLVEGQQQQSVWMQQQSDNTSAPSGQQWNLEMLNVFEAWANLSSHGQGTTVAVIDSGIAETAMPAFSGRVLQGYDFVSDPDLSEDGDGRDPDFYDPGGTCGGDNMGLWHGTHVASILGANFSGFYGVAPAASILPVRVLGRCSTGYASDVADAIVWASGGQINGLMNGTSSFDEGSPRVIIMSFAGVGACPSFMQTAVDLAISRNVVLYAAAGNNPIRYAAEYFPANCRGVKSVGSLTREGKVSSYTSMKPKLFMLGGDFGEGGGVPCLGADLDAGWSTCMGTSIAVPHAGGLHALRFWMVDRWIAASEEAGSEWLMYVQDAGKYVHGQVLMSSKMSTVAMGRNHACAVFSTGYMKCWGSNANGQLGYGDTVSRSSIPSAYVDLGVDGDVSFPWKVQNVVVSDTHTCALLASTLTLPGIKCWGDGTYGQLGYTNTGPARSPPAAVFYPSNKNVVSIAAGFGFTCARLADGSVMCWGLNTQGQLSRTLSGGVTQTVTPQTVTIGLSGNSAYTKHLTAGYCHACFIRSDNVVMCWGCNSNGQLGDNSQTNRFAPTAVVQSGWGGSTPRALSAGSAHTCAVLVDGNLLCWGRNSEGQLGYGDSTQRLSVPTTSVNLLGSTAVNVSAGANYTCVSLSTGSLKCWGSNANGQLGLGDASNRLSPASQNVSLGTGLSASTSSCNTLGAEGATTVGCAGGCKKQLCHVAHGIHVAGQALHAALDADQQCLQLHCLSWWCGCCIA